MEFESDLQQQYNELLRVVDDMKEEKKDLIYELNDYKTKYEECLNQFNSVLSEKKTIPSQKESDYKDEIEDLKRRLSISLKNQEDLKESVEQQRSSESLTHQKDIEIIENKYNRIINDYKHQVENQTEANKKKDEELSKVKNENLCINSMVTRLTRLLSKQNNEDFQTIEEALRFLSKPKQETKKESSKEVDELKEYAKHLESQISSMNRQIKMLKAHVIDAEDEREVIQQTYEAKISQMNEKQEDEIQAMKIEFQKIIEAEKTKNVEIETEKPKIYRNIFTQSEEDKSVSVEEFENLNEVVKAKTNEIERLKFENEELLTVNQQLEADKREIKEETMRIANDVKERIGELSKFKEIQKETEDKMAKQEEDSKALKAKLNDTLHELESTNSKLKIAETTNKSMNESMEMIYEELENNSKEMEELTAEREKHLTVLLDQKLMIETMANAITKMDAKIKALKANQNNYIEHDEDIEFSFDFSDFPNDLARLLSQISSNDAVNFNIRLKNIFMVIAKWINTTDEEHKASIYDQKNKLSESDRTTNLVLGNIKGVLKDETVEYEKLPEIISGLLDQIEQEKEKFNYQEEIVKETANVLNERNYEAFPERIQSIIKEKNEVECLLEAEKKERRKDKELFKQTKINFGDSLYRRDNQIKELEKTNKHNRKQIERLNESINELNESNRKLIEKMEAANEKNSLEYKAMQKQYESEVYNKMQEIAASKIEFSKKINELEANNKELQKRIEEIENEKCAAEDNFNTKIQKIQNETMRCKNESVMNQNNEENMRVIMEKKIDEINDLYSSTKDALTQEKADREKEREEFNAKINEMLSINAPLNEKIAQLSIENKKLKSESKLKEKAYKRSIDMINAQTKAQLVIDKTNSQLELEEERNNHSSHLRSIFSYFAQNFAQFYDPSQRINEDTFKKLVVIIKKELEKSRKQDKAVRNFLNASEEQSTEEALTKYIIDSHPKFRTE